MRRRNIRLLMNKLTALDEKDIEVMLKKTINPYDSIRAYIDELAAGWAIILVLSEEYFKSPNCMYELRHEFISK